MALRQSDSPSDQTRATQDEASLEVWLGVIAAYPEMRQWVAHNKTVPHAVLQVLATDPDPVVRWWVAGKRKLDSAVLRMLAADEDESVRARVARHRRTEPEVLSALAHDESWVVREAAEEVLASRRLLRPKSSRELADVRSRYLPPTSDTPIELEVGSADALDEVLRGAASYESDRGLPAVELVRSDGSTLVVGQTRQGMVLLMINSLGEPSHSVGSGDPVDNTVVLDYLGSYTEVPAEFVVPVDLGRAAALAFLNGEDPATAGLTLEPD